MGTNVSVLTESGGMLDNRPGNYRILPSGPAYCAGVVPDEDYEVVRTELHIWVPLDRAFEFIEQHLRSVGRPVQAFCGIELRVPAPLTPADWSTFNVPYLDKLGGWGLTYGNYSGVCRSNIALDIYPPQVTVMCAFSYTKPSRMHAKTFLLSGQADIRADGTVVAGTDTGPDAMLERSLFTINAVTETLTTLGASWDDTTRVALFHVHDIPDVWGKGVMGAIGEPLRKGVLVYRARPPIAGGEVELEARAVQNDLVLHNR